MTARTVIYDAGMLAALLRAKPVAVAIHHALRAAPHRPVLIGPVLAQTWRPDPRTVHVLRRYLEDCTVPQARGSAAPVRDRPGSVDGCVACAQTFTLDSYKRTGAMLGAAVLPAKARPDAIDALVVIAAALHGPAQILTSDPRDIAAYVATLDRADITIERV